MSAKILALLIIMMTLILPLSAATTDTTSADSAMQATSLTDSAYRQFILDSLRLESESEIARLDAVHRPGLEPEGIIALMIPIISIITVFLFLWRSNESRKAVRLAMIEKGMDPSMLNEGTEGSRKYGALRIGMLLAGIGLGLLVGFAITQGLGLWDQEFVPLIIISSAVLFGGAGLIGYHRMVSKMEADRKG